MYILVKKFSLRHNNVVYAAGSVVELPDNVAKQLYDDAPEEFEIIGEPEAEATVPEDVEIISKTEAEKPASGKKSKKQPASKSISKESACDDEDALSAVDEAATVQ
ncbi:hypothetical protein [uncultured Phascolarctobacterium sp.]|uniref:hypothetical protein n=1 Tax=uncultured Phascolarctobacterium sp. TaxID=512296 RepID=UPI0025F56678|nr:hypothetical protein [uncultured Phascolarctobacterium sp.]